VVKILTFLDLEQKSAFAKDSLIHILQEKFKTNGRKNNDEAKSSSSRRANPEE